MSHLILCSIHQYDNVPHSSVKELVEYADDVIVDVPMLWSYLPEILAKPCLELSADEGKQLIACALDKRLKTKASADFITGFMKAVAKVSVSCSVRVVS